MSGSISGGKKTAEYLKKQDPDFYRKLGRLGGRKKVPKGFAKMDKKKVAEAGRKGGSKSKRGNKVTVKVGKSYKTTPDNPIISRGPSFLDVVLRRNQ